jgi:hypothetical protein
MCREALRGPRHGITDDSTFESSTLPAMLNVTQGVGLAANRIPVI